MSSDLLGAFGAPETELCSGSKLRQVSPRIDPDDEEDDDFGDFEDAQKEYDDIGVQDENKDLTKPHNGDSTIFEPPFEEHKGWGQSGLILEDPGRSSLQEERGDFTGQEVIFDADRFDQKPASIPENLTKQQQIRPPVGDFDFDADESWDPVDVSQAPIIPTPVSTAVAPTARSEPAEVLIPMASKVAVKKSLGLPPTNIPPPSVLLSAITNFFQSLLARVRDIVTLHRTSSDPFESLDESRISALQKQISVVRASARIIAGRKLRWKRDTILSQSMRIGPAGQAGMKLSSVDKNETRREDQEVSEAVHIWKKQIGPLRSTIARLNIHLSGEGLTIPDISETIPVRVGKPSEGAVKAPKCCFLCGTNRDERVAKVDVWVEDSFGEWWVEHWGHVDCVAFWEIVKEDLPQR